MISIQDEISRTLPHGAPTRYFVGGTPILYAYGCALLEDDLGDYIIYRAVNLETGKSVKIGRRKRPLALAEAEQIVERIRALPIAGEGRYVIDRQYGQRISLEKCREILNKVFREVLPEYGYLIREEQIELSDTMLGTIHSRTVALAEAEVGTGKTLAYLVAAIIAKRGRLNDFWNKSLYPKMSHVDMAQMPIVIATSSIALQKAILTEYIPELSDILMGCGIIKTPISAVLRKGREHYVCERNLRNCLSYERNQGTKQKLRELLAPKAPIDTAEIEGLDRYTKRLIAVPEKCVYKCPYRTGCAYLQFRNYAADPSIDIQVLNHNYLLADLNIRENGDTGRRPLIPNYQTLIIDEAHKFLSAARTMFGSELSSFALTGIRDIVDKLSFERGAALKLARSIAKRLHKVSRLLFADLYGHSCDEEADEEATRFAAVIDNGCGYRLRSLRDGSGRLCERISSEPVSTNGAGKKSDILWGLSAIREQLAALSRHGENICWIEMPDINITAGETQEIKLCAIPRDIDERLYKQLWGRGIPTILTSGTLSAGGDFSHIKRTLGLERVGNRLTETSKPSPFNHRENAILYISDNMPFPDPSSSEYIAAIATETEKLILASHGHAAVLFTSYKVMDMVWEKLKERGLPFPFFKLDKGRIMEIEKFKQSCGGVLFAAGAMWEGIDIPGDALSMLIIVKLPFRVPDPIGEYERTLYKDTREYMTMLMLPETFIKCKQGAGRVLRAEKDTGCVAIVDIRAATTFREGLLAALPNYRVTSDIDDVVDFFDRKKPAEYFM
jgi:ATP-dependent DNA helicase DinG